MAAVTGPMHFAYDSEVNAQEVATLQRQHSALLQ